MLVVLWGRGGGQVLMRWGREGVRIQWTIGGILMTLEVVVLGLERLKLRALGLGVLRSKDRLDCLHWLLQGGLIDKRVIIDGTYYCDDLGLLSQVEKSRSTKIPT